MSIITEEKLSQHGATIGVLTLDRPNALHALTSDMLRQLSNAIHDWAGRDDVVAVVLSSSSDRAFCAGGDIREMYHVVQTQSAEAAGKLAAEYFAVEYSLEYLLHRFPKPVIVWGGGIVMGGGWGLFAGCSHRIITESTRMAMPEVHIGLYPDAGGSWFLSRLPGNIGKFLALTGTSIFPRDIMRLGIADYCLATSQKAACLEGLLALPWSDQASRNYDLVTRWLNELSDKETFDLPDANLFPVRTAISKALLTRQASTAVSSLLSLKGLSPWLDAALNDLAKGSPLSQHLAFAMQDYAKHASLADCFRLEWWVSQQCCLYPDYCEGVRARLIDRDGEPKWQASSLAGVPTGVLSTFLSPDPLWLVHPDLQLK